MRKERKLGCLMMIYYTMKVTFAASYLSKYLLVLELNFWTRLDSPLGTVSASKLMLESFLLKSESTSERSYRDPEESKLVLEAGGSSCGWFMESWLEAGET